MKFKTGDKVKWLDTDTDDGMGYTYYGEVTIPGDKLSKVIFENRSDNCEAYIPDYQYYDNDELELK